MTPSGSHREPASTCAVASLLTLSLTLQPFSEAEGGCCCLCPSVLMKDCAREVPGSHRAWFEGEGAAEVGKPTFLFFFSPGVCFFLFLKP